MRFLLGAAAILTLQGSAGAQPLPPKIQSNAYNIEIFQGPLIAPIHVTGVGGAYVAVAEGRRDRR